jgi:hypothetical protein
MDPTIPAIATVIAALIGGLIAFLSAVLSKESKTSEFRYTWLNSVLDDIAKFSSVVESISATASSIQETEGNEKVNAFLRASEPEVREALDAYYRARIRLYPKEHERVLSALGRLRALFLTGSAPDPSLVSPLVQEIVQEGHNALKDEWGKVKRGETIFVVTKWFFLGVFVLAFLIGMGFAISSWLNRPQPAPKVESAPVVAPKK